MKNLINKRFLITGGSGFIGSNFISLLNLKTDSNVKILNIDKLSPQSCHEFVSKYNNCIHIKDDLSDQRVVKNIICEFRPHFIVHFAAESHVDRSIDQPDLFFHSNSLATLNLFESIRQLIKEKNLDQATKIINISTDEVYGDLQLDDPKFNEDHKFSPSSPYSASKAASDCIAMSYLRTFGLNIITTHCSNNFGPRQHPEKLIPSTIYKFLNNIPVGIYGNGENIRDWIYVDEHNLYILGLLNKIKPAYNSYNIGSNKEINNIQIVENIKKIMHENFSLNLEFKIKFIEDRLGHDYRYAINNERIKSELIEVAVSDFDLNFLKTVEWFIKNKEWLDRKIKG